MRSAAAKLLCSSATTRMVAQGIIVPPRSRSGLVVKNETTQQQRLERAKGYPYSRPDSSFVFINGSAFTFPCSSWVPPNLWGGSLQPLLQLQVNAPDGSTSSLQTVLEQQGVAPTALAPDTPLTPILAIGSNAGPQQLARKFPPELFPGGVVVPVVQCVLRDFDVVYAPLLSSYGAATATLEHCPGTDVAVFVTWLTPALQQRMHETEGAYNLCRLDGIQLLEATSLQQHSEGVAAPAVMRSVFNYNHQHGSLHLPFANPGSSPVALAEIQAAGRRFPALGQVQMQAALRIALQDVTAEQLLGAAQEQEQQQQQQPASEAAGLRTVPSMHKKPGVRSSSSSSSAVFSEEGLDDWILTNLEQPALRKARVQALAQAALPFSYPQCDVLLTLGTPLSASVK